MAILVIAEHDNQSIKAATLNTVSAAAKLGGDIHVLVAGANCGAAAEAAAKIAGVAKVLACDAAHYEAQTAENVAELVKGLAGAYSHLLAPATPAGKNVLPRVAALLDVAQISEIVAIEAADTFVRPIYAGNALATVNASGTADLRLSMVAGTPNPFVSDNTTVYVVLTNEAASTSDPVRIQVTRDPLLNPVSALASHGTYDLAAGTWMVGPVPAGGAATLALVLRVADAGLLRHIA